MSGEAFRDYIEDSCYGSYESYDDWLSQRRKRRESGLPADASYRVDKIWDWRDPDESWIEKLILATSNETRATVGILTFFGGGFAWFILEFVLLLVFNEPSSVGFTWEVPMDTGLVILFALCGTVLGSVAMWCVTVYKLRMAQLRERKEIRQAEVDKEMWKRLPMESMQKAISTR